MSRANLSPNRFAQVPDAILSDTRVSATAVRVYAIILRYQGRHEVAWPGLRTVALDYGIPRSTVSDAVAELEATGWLFCERRLGTSSLYRPVDQVSGAPEGVSGGPDTVSGGPDGVSGAPDVTIVMNESQERESRTTGATEGRTHADRLCSLLADQVERVTDRRPKVTDRWLVAARLLVDADGQSPEAVERAIAWVARDSFWSTVILSMPKLREKWPTLTAQARRGTSQSNDAETERRRAALREWAEQEDAA